MRQVARPKKRHTRNAPRNTRKLKLLPAPRAALKEMAAYEMREVGLEEKRKHASSKAEQLKKLLQEEENAHSDALRSIQETAAKLKNETRKANRCEEELRREEGVLAAIRDGLEGVTLIFRDRIEQKQRELQPWEARVNQKQAEVDVKTSERDALVKQAEAVAQASAEAQEALRTARSDQRAKIGTLEELEARVQALQQETKGGEQTVQDLTIRVNQLRVEASTTRHRAEEAAASHAASTSRKKALQVLTFLRNSGRAGGFHGRLGSLGTIPGEYDTAITAACRSLNDMVTDTAQQGQALVEHLRKLNAGRADFLALEEIDETNGMRTVQTPENVPRLFDLVKPKDARFAHAFYKALRDTLVAQDLAQANRIAFGARRWRVVTLAGALVDSSGTMSGGGAKLRGSMGSDFAVDAVLPALLPDVLQKYEQDSEAADARLTEAMEELRAAEAKLAAVAKTIPPIDLKIDLVTLDVSHAGMRVVEAEKLVRDLRARAQRKSAVGDLSRVAFLEHGIAAAQHELKGSRSKSSTIKEAIRALEKTILDIGGSRLLTQKSKVDGLKPHIAIANEEITKAEVAMVKVRTASVKLEGSIARNRQCLQGVEIELGKLTESLQEVKARVADIRAEVENSEDDLPRSQTKRRRV